MTVLVLNARSSMRAGVELDDEANAATTGKRARRISRDGSRLALGIEQPS